MGATVAGPTFDIDRLATRGDVADTSVVTELVLLLGLGSEIPGGKVTVAVLISVTAAIRTPPADCGADFCGPTGSADAPGAVPTTT